MDQFAILAKFFLSNSFLLLCSLLMTGCNLSGSVTIDGLGVSEVRVFLKGDTQMETTTDANGHYTFTEVPDGEYQVSIDAPEGYTGTVSIPVTKSGDVTDINFVMNSETLRTTSKGKIIGNKENNGIHAWRGIPFAKPPIDGLRWKAPLTEEAWGDDLAYLALRSKEVCVEPTGAIVPGEVEGEGLIQGTEDCLYLDVKAPAFSPDNIPTGNERLPVLVWIYGGGNVATYKDGQDGKILAKEHNMIVVAFNYRQGHMGWFSHPALETGDALDDSGNYGTLDTIRALEWVQENIASFGGDPNNVTVGGVSAGSFNTYALMISKEAEGLFHKAISQSGYITTYEMETVQNYTEDGGYFNSSREVINNLLIRDGSAANRLAAKNLQNNMSKDAIRDYLYSKSATEILLAGQGPQLQPHDSTLQEAGFFPVITKFRDGVVLPKEDPMQVFTNTNQYNAVPLLTGATRDESKPFVAFDPAFVNLLAGLPIGSKDRSYYDLFNGYKADYFRIKGVDNIAETISGNPSQPSVYTYRFDWDNSPTILIAELPHLIGAGHALDTPFVFNLTDEPGEDFFSTFFFTDQNAHDRRTLATSMSSYWAEFIHNGSPANGRNNSENITWLPWTNSANNMMFLDGVEDQGIRMKSSLLTMEDLKSRVLAENRFPSQEKHCAMYEELFSRSIYWNQEEYLGLGAQGCATHSL